MATGCQGPFCHGTGGWCGCNCKCCPPPCCPVVSARFQCVLNPPCPPAMAEDIVWQDGLPEPPQPMPTFDKKPIFSKNKNFLFGGPFPTSTSLPVQAICVPIFPGSPGVCCFEVINGGIVAVGNGYVNAPTSIVADNGCNNYKVKINGKVPPVWVNDCDPIVITLEPVETCCVCQLVDISCGPCQNNIGMLYLPQNRLWKKLINRSNNKIRINPETGLPYIYIDKAELLRRIIERRQKLRRKK